MNCGIYAIWNRATGQLYIGRSANMRSRIGNHFNQLRKGVHENRHLQASFAKYGETMFGSFTVLVCRRADLPTYEYLVIKAWRSDDHAFGFNLTIATDEGLLTHGPAARAAISAALRERVPYERTPEIRAKIAAALTGKVGPNKGRKFSPEHRANIAASKRGNQFRLGKTHPADGETRRKISDTLKARWDDPEFRAEQIATLQSADVRARNPGFRGRAHSPEAKEKMRQASLARQPKEFSDEFREKMRQAALKRWHPDVGG